jgi:hypothetical protein
MSARLEPHHSEAMGEYDHEPVPGLPGHLPKDERVLWQGSPDWRSLAIRAFHARKVAIYCVVLMAWHFYGRLYDGYTVAMALNALMIPVLLTIAVTALLTGLGWLSARTTIYTITNRRVVLRAGIAIPMSINIPFKSLAEGNLKLHRDGTGDVVLKIAGNDRIAYLHLWPHVRRWRFKRPEPMLRCLPDPLRAAEILGRAVAPEAPPELSIVESDAARSRQAGPTAGQGRAIPVADSRPRFAAAAR